MFSPLRTYRRWHRKIVLGQKRYAVASALAASAVPALVTARGHRISQIPEIPLVISNEAFEGLTKTKKAVALLKKLSVDDDIRKAKYSVVHRAGLGKMRNRPYKEKLGPILVHNVRRGGFGVALRNLPGLEIAHVDRLNLLRLAPGGHLGRFIIWTRGAFERLETMWGNPKSKYPRKFGWKAPNPILSNPDIARVIISDEIRSVIRPIRKIVKHKRWVNPFRNVKRMKELNPHYHMQARQQKIINRKNREKNLEATIKKRTEKKAAKKDAPDARKNSEEDVEATRKKKAAKKKAAKEKAAKDKDVPSDAAKDIKEAVTTGVTVVTQKISNAFKKLLNA